MVVRTRKQMLGREIFFKEAIRAQLHFPYKELTTEPEDCSPATYKTQ